MSAISSLKVRLRESPRRKYYAPRIDRRPLHLLDMIGIGLVDASWPARYALELGQRLQELLDNPDG